MIARLWHGRVPAAKADAYDAFLKARAMPDYEGTPGNRGASILRRSEGGVTHFLLVTLWESVDAIEAFAGKPIERAKYYAEDDEYLLEFEANVVHYDVSYGA